MAFDEPYPCYGSSHEDDGVVKRPGQAFPKMTVYKLPILGPYGFTVARRAPDAGVNCTECRVLSRRTLYDTRTNSTIVCNLILDGGRN